MVILSGMDEILIGEKKYVSSRRAAKVTGYAKDYIGQLCREGRVPARLVGRAWYVLETAIQDHRFGKQGIESENEPPASLVAELPSKSSPVSTWESPRYEASSAEILPFVNRLRPALEPSKGINAEDIPTDAQEVPDRLQDSWRTWFDRVADTEPVDLATLTVPEEQEKKKPAEVPMQEIQEVNIPIHTVYDLPPQDLLPRQHLELEVELPSAVVEVHIEKKRSRGTMMAIQMAGAVLATLVAILAVIGTGYFDKYITSNSPVSSIAGVILYNK